MPMSCDEPCAPPGMSRGSAVYKRCFGSDRGSGGDFDADEVAVSAIMLLRSGLCPRSSHVFTIRAAPPFIRLSLRYTPQRSRVTRSSDPQFSRSSFMPVRVCCPQFDPVVRSAVTDAVRHVIQRWRPSFELWRLSVFRSQSGHEWDLAISGPRFRRVFTLT